MLSIAPGKPDIYKKTLYLIAATVLGILLGFIAYGLIEINFIHSIYRRGNIAYFDRCLNVFLMLQILFLVFGAFAGFCAGRFCWQKIYVDRAWASKNIKWDIIA